MSVAPPGWADVSLGDLFELKYGKSLPERARKPGPHKVYGSNGVVGHHKSHITEAPAIIVGRKGSIGEVHFSEEQCFPIDTTYYVDRFDGVTPHFAKYLLQAAPLRDMNRATAIPGLNREDAYALTVQLPPLREQCRIVAKIDSLTSKSKRAREQLDHIPSLIEKYKQAVLTAGFSSATFKPTRLGDIVDEGPTNGYSPRASNDSSGTLSLKLTATTRGVLDLSDKATKLVGETIEPGSRFWLEPGDLLIQRSNSREYVGASAIYEGPRYTYIYPDLMMRVRIQDPEVRRYVWRFLNSREARAYFRANATGTAGNMPKINGATVRNLLVPLPSLPQIPAINQAIETAFGSIDRLAAEAGGARKLIDRLNEAILAKAFRGELVLQDPNDESARALLDRIREQRAARPLRAKRKPRKGSN